MFNLPQPPEGAHSNIVSGAEMTNMGIPADGMTATGSGQQQLDVGQAAQGYNELNESQPKNLDTRP